MMAVLSAVRNGSSEGDVKEENVCPQHAVPPVVWKKTYNKTKRVYKNVGCRFEGESNGNGGFLEHAKRRKEGQVEPGNTSGFEGGDENKSKEMS